MLHTRYTTGNRRPSYAFLMEMLWVCGLFAAAACIFVTAFVKADAMSSRAEDLNQAVMAAENEMERTFLSKEEGTRILFFDSEWNMLPQEKKAFGTPDSTPLPDAPADAHAFLQVTGNAGSGLLTVTIEAHVLHPREEVIYTLTGSRSLGPEEPSPDNGEAARENKTPPEPSGSLDEPAGEDASNRPDGTEGRELP